MARPKHEDLAARRARVAALRRAGLTIDEIMAEVGLSRTQVYADLQEKGLSRLPGRAGAALRGRRRQVIELWGQGLTRDEIAERLGVGRGAIAHDCQVLGLPSQRQLAITRRRYRVASLLEAGHEPDEVAAMLGIDKSTVHRDKRLMAERQAERNLGKAIEKLLDQLVARWGGDPLALRHPPVMYKGGCERCDFVTVCRQRVTARLWVACCRPGLADLFRLAELVALHDRPAPPPPTMIDWSTGWEPVVDDAAEADKASPDGGDGAAEDERVTDEEEQQP